MEERPSYFDTELIINDYKFYANEQEGVYVPENEKDFNEFITALFKLIDDPTEDQVDSYNLILKYPFLLPKNRWDRSLSIDSEYGFDFTWTEIDTMPYGWLKAFGMQMVEELKEVIISYKPGFLYKYTIIDIKEKYGGLRWYDNGATREMYDIIEKYENLSYETCIKCGKPATHMTEGWIAPLCDECDNK
jgi:hypothetical protein